jgi:phage baseplate assembly protein V
MTLLDQINKLLSPIYRKVSSMICKAIIISLNDSSGLQVCKVQMMKDEELTGVERLGEFGFVSNPPDDSEAVVVFANGDRSKGIIIATESARYRLKLPEKGATAIYNQQGDYVKITKDKIEVYAKEVIIAGGTKKLITEDILTLLNSHVHTCASPGSPSGPALSPGPNPFTTLLHATIKTTAE